MLPKSCTGNFLSACFLFFCLSLSFFFNQVSAIWNAFLGSILQTQKEQVLKVKIAKQATAGKMLLP
jgi:hypothetical protein